MLRFLAALGMTVSKGTCHLLLNSVTRHVSPHSTRPAYRHIVNPQRRLPHAHGHALAFFAAYADAVVHRHVMADHADVLEAFWPVANQRGAFDGVEFFAVFYLPRFSAAKHKLAAGGVYLAAAEAGAVNTIFDAGQNFFWRCIAAQHVGVGHARHG
jgi:hypothetical protein